MAASVVGVAAQTNKKPRQQDDYKPRTLKELAELKTTTETIKDDVMIQGDIVPSRATVVYEGESRPISQNKKDAIAAWAARYAGMPEFYTGPYETELLFSEGERKYWLAVKKPQSGKQFTKGQRLDLHLIKLGSVKTGDTWEPLLLVERIYVSFELRHDP